MNPLSLLLCCAPLLLASAIPASGEELADTSWKLVRIQSMNDTSSVPDDATVYTLELKADGSAVIQADCNQGRGTWSANTENQIEFGPIASTFALCPGGSLSEEYLKQFQWVRSFTVENGHLFLATMADGSIIEFEPVANGTVRPPVVGRS